MGERNVSRDEAFDELTATIDAVKGPGGTMVEEYLRYRMEVERIRTSDDWKRRQRWMERCRWFDSNLTPRMYETADSNLKAEITRFLRTRREDYLTADELMAERTTFRAIREGLDKEMERLAMMNGPAISDLQELHCKIDLALDRGAIDAGETLNRKQMQMEAQVEKALARLNAQIAAMPGNRDSIAGGESEAKPNDPVAPEGADDSASWRDRPAMI